MVRSWHQTLITRRGDSAVLGSITPVEGGHLATRTCLGAPENLGIAATDLKRVFTQDPDPKAEAEAWVRSNPYILDTQTCPTNGGVVGPVLATWGDLLVIGVVHQLPEAYARFCHGLQGTLMTGSVLLVMNAEGLIVAHLEPNRGSWNVAMDVPTEVDMVLIPESSWTAAVDSFRTGVISEFCQGSHHLMMEIRAVSLDLDALATDFLALRPALRVALGLDAPDRMS